MASRINLPLFSEHLFMVSQYVRKHTQDRFQGARVRHGMARKVAVKSFLNWKNLPSLPNEQWKVGSRSPNKK
jgi:hypothetical protein